MNGYDVNSAHELLEQHASITFDPLVSEISGQINMQRVLPMQIGSLGPQNLLTFIFNSDNQYVDLNRSYMNFDLQELQANGSVASTAANTLNTFGAESIFSQITETYAGTTLPYIQNFNLYKASVNTNANVTRQQLLSLTSGFIPNNGAALCAGNTTGLIGGQGGMTIPATALAPSAPITYSVPVPLQALSSARQIPLCFLNGGIKLEIQLAPYNQVYQLRNTTGAGANTYAISNVVLMLAFTKPPDDVLIDTQEKLNAGQFLDLPLELVKNYSISLQAGTTQQITQYIGYYKSLNSVTVLYRKAANLNGANPLFFSTDTLSTWFLNLNTQRYPQNKEIYCEGRTPLSRENQINIVRAFNTQLDSISPYVAAYNGMMYWSWKENHSFQSGISSNNGVFQWIATFSTTCSSGDTIDLFLNYDVPLRIGASGISFSLS